MKYTGEERERGEKIYIKKDSGGIMEIRL